MEIQGHENSLEHDPCLQPDNWGLYESCREHDGCGIGAVVNINGKKDHAILEHGKQILLNLHHRGAASADQATGDGAGILFQIPDKFFRLECKKTALRLPSDSKYAVGQIFEPRATDLRERCEKILESAIENYQMKVLVRNHLIAMYFVRLMHIFLFYGIIREAKVFFILWKLTVLKDL